MTLKKDITTLSLLLTSLGGIVGSGWLLGPFYAAKLAGPASIIAWIVGGILMIVIALTFAELSSTFPLAGGTVRFAHLSHGAFTSFTMAWIFWLAAVMVAPIETMAALQYAGNYVPGLVNSSVGHTSLTHFGLVIAAAVMLFMCSINFFAVKYFAKSNSVIVSWKLIIPIVTAIILFSHHFSSNNFKVMMPYGIHSVLHALPAAGIIFSFIGFSPAIQLAAEAKNPAKAIPIAILGSITLAIILYVVVETAFIGAINPKSLLNGWKHMTFSGDSGPIAGIVASIGIMWFLKVIYIDALISPVGTAYIYTAATSRINMAMAENGYMPDIMKKLNRNGTPYISILMNFVVGMIFFLPFPGWQSMVSFLVSCFVLAYAIGPLSCAKLRQTMPDQPRPFKVPCVNLFCLLAFYISNLIVYWTGWEVIWKMLLTLAIGYLFFIINAVFYKKDIDIDFAKGKWLIPYLIGIGVISYLGSFGGIDVLKFGPDFLVILIFTIAIFCYSQGFIFKSQKDLLATSS